MALLCNFTGHKIAFYVSELKQGKPMTGCVHRDITLSLLRAVMSTSFV